ncbi:MAG: EamA family transporter RarD [Deltaproteobacteria bacterium]|nr:EamA family transporter RarD [Deltaproteobacteria bacterium]
MTTSPSQRAGVFYGLAAFCFWGLVPVYFKAVGHVPPFEILCHRIVWSVAVTALLISIGRDWRGLRAALASGKVLPVLFLSAALAATNWFVFIYAITTNRVLQTSLGYFINPLVNVLLGMIFLKERLRPLQGVSVLLAAAGTLNLAFSYGEFPWIALTLAFSFGLYGLLRKTVRIESVNGLFVETTLISPLALAYLVFIGARGGGAFGSVDGWTTLLLVLAGMVTSFPLVWFTCAARRLPYTTIGFLQYLAPSLQFLLAVLVYHEPFTMTHLVTFALIWSGLVVFVGDSLLRIKR